MKSQPPKPSAARGATDSAVPASDGKPPRRSYLWLWFVGAFLIQAGAWTTWFIIAGKHRVEEVPLVSFEPVKR